MKNHEKEKEINLLSCTLKVVVAKYPFFSSPKAIINSGRCQGDMSVGDVRGRCQWEMSVGDVSGRCQWEMSV